LRRKEEGEEEVGEEEEAQLGGGVSEF